MKKLFAQASLGLSVGLLSAASLPHAEIANGQIRAKIYLPDGTDGFYRGTRFDWSGVIYSLQAHGHDYYGPWFDKTDPSVHDFVYRGADIVAGPCSAITGPVDEFKPLGWDESKAGGHFVKIGVGTLRKPAADEKYDNYKLYDIADGGRWIVKQTPDSIEFTQELMDQASGYGYLYRKTLRLVEGQPQMVLEHSLKNTGKRTIHTTVYNHNFLVLDNQPPGPDFTITVPFAIKTSHPPNKELAGIRGNQIVYLKKLQGHDVVAMPLEGFSEDPQDNQIRIENSRLGAGIRIVADRPLFSESLWSIRTVIAMEPFISISVEPGKEFTWKSTYDYYQIPADHK